MVLHSGSRSEQLCNLNLCRFCTVIWYTCIGRLKFKDHGRSTYCKSTISCIYIGSSTEKIKCATLNFIYDSNKYRS